MTFENLSIRGISHVAIYYDGVARNGTAGLLADITEVGHVEILRGPQGALNRVDLTASVDTPLTFEVYP